MHHATTKEQGRLSYHTILPFKVYNGYNVHIGIILLCYVYLQLHRALSPPPRTPSFEDATLEHISVFFFRERGVVRELIQPRGNPIARTIIGFAMEFRRILLTGTHTQILSGHLTRLIHVYVQIMRYECRCFFVN